MGLFSTGIVSFNLCFDFNYHCFLVLTEHSFFKFNGFFFNNKRILQFSLTILLQFLDPSSPAFGRIFMSGSMCSNATSFDSLALFSDCLTIFSIHLPQSWRLFYSVFYEFNINEFFCLLIRLPIFRIFPTFL